MKNKEIKKILKYLKNNTYIPDETKRKYKILHKDEVNLLLSYIEQLENNKDKAIEKLYCWGEVLDPDFQKEMLNILKGDNNGD